MVARLTAAIGVLAVCGVLAGAAGTFAAVEQARKEERRQKASELTGGHAELAEPHILRYGCAACHVIPGIRARNGLVGPPLADIGRRIYIAGVLTNTPENMVRWLLNPPALKPGTAMPSTGLSEAEAQRLTAFLETLQ